MKRNNDNRNNPKGIESDTLSQFEYLFVANYDKLKFYVSRYIKRSHDVEDIVQETFVKSYQAQNRTPITNLKTYFYTTARNLSFNHLARHDNKITDYIEDLELVEVLGCTQGIEEEMQACQQFSIFCEAVRELPLQCRRVFILKKVYGLSHVEISERLGISINTVNKHLAKGISRCTVYMREKGYLDDILPYQASGRSKSE